MQQLRTLWCQLTAVLDRYEYSYMYIWPCSPWPVVLARPESGPVATVPVLARPETPGRAWAAGLARGTARCMMWPGGGLVGETAHEGRPPAHPTHPSPLVVYKSSGRGASPSQTLT